LTAAGDNILWYDVASGGTALGSSATLTSRKYYASQTVGVCESATRVEVTVTVTPPEVFNQHYEQADFGDAGIWMTENLRATHYADGMCLSLTHDRTASNYTAKYYAYPNENADGDAHVTTHGLLYTWAAATGRTGVDATEGYGQTEPDQVQGICPAGWHLPTDTEWSDLEKAIAEDSEGKYSAPATTTWQDSYKTAIGTRGSHGNKMKSVTAPYYNNNETYHGTSKGANDGGFDAILAGFVIGGNMTSYGQYTNFWTSSSKETGLAWARYLFYDHTGVPRNGSYKSAYFSVRCKKN
jgi:uncharacterized protein (TIGR02145 family)